MRKSRSKTKMVRKLSLRDDLVSTEQIRMICSNIENVTKKEKTFMMITTPNHEEQKPLVSIKMAISFAEQGKNVLLVDANFRKPSLHDCFHFNNLTGLTHVIMKEEKLESCIQETFIHGLHLLPTGPIPTNPLDAWVSNRVSTIMNEWRQRYDIVIFESPPFLDVADAQIVSQYCDGVVLMMRENSTKKEEALLTKNYLERANQKILGVIYLTG
ncbi:CpsD/CapB family tyrosine-protein kinase [Evansella sp. AB-P1]|uniref:CpsD/CapB family tyrosine-protein kinase n=1 Tax=Evansella sp. AB-P1 TaxID=3037653 RepID=UPI00241F90D2|nr:CpsD/CapB family tyrosine-protein kinase [Evansella sp. AB-P1]MDG5787891.1 CpsD/CapB family tyrosine-protein kinase [Evansella sp. AB-P1]